MSTKSRFRQSGNYTEELTNRTEESSAGNYINIFNKEGEKLPFWKDSEGDHALDIIPYLASEHHPNHPKGTHVYKVEIWVHKRTGPDKGDYICLRNYGEDCPLCDARTKENQEEFPRKKILEALKGSQRCFYNVVVYTNNQEDKGVQIWEASSWLAESKFKETAKNKRTGVRVPFADPDKGKTITFTIKGTKTNKKLEGVVFEERPDIISDEILDQAINIEDYLLKPTVEELKAVAKAVLAGAIPGDDDEPALPRSRRGSDSQESSKEPEDKEPEETSSRRGRMEPEDKEPENVPEETSSRRGRGRSEEPEKEPEETSSRRRRDPEDASENNSSGDEPPATRRLRRRE